MNYRVYFFDQELKKMPHENRFRFRNFTSLTLLFSFLILGLSGVALYIRPEGSIARWTGWSFLGLDKKGWEGLHTLFSFLFLVFSVAHIFFNWKVLVSFLRKKISEGMKLRKELFASTVFVALFSFVVIMRWQPFWVLNDWRSTLKKARYMIAVEPPTADFEKKSLREAAAAMDRSTDELMQRLRGCGYGVKDPEERMVDIARSNKTSPEKIYKALLH